MKLPVQYPTVVRIPTPFAVSGEVGLGDVIKQVTAALGIPPCAPCQARAEALNRRIVFSNRPRSSPGER